MKPYNFHKNKFPGLGSLSPAVKKAKAAQEEAEWKALEQQKVEFQKGVTILDAMNKVLGFFKEAKVGETKLPPDTLIVQLEKPVDFIKMEFTVDKNPCGEVELTKPQQNVPPAQKEEEKKPVATKKKANGKTPKKDKGKAIYGWVFTSSREVEGMRAQYQTLLWEDGSVSCNCHGWIFPKKDPKTGEKVRSCKHTKEVQEESKPSASDIFKKWKKGEPLPEVDTTTQMMDKSIPVSFHKTGSSIKYERKMDI